MKAVHLRLRRALELARDGLQGEDSGAARDLLLYCRGFCAALSRHHLGEDRTLFPAIAAQHPALVPVLEKLRQDHSMIAYLLTALERAVDDDAGRDALERHLEGIGAIMESHFRYEERQLLSVLAELELDSDISEALGPLSRQSSIACSGDPRATYTDRMPESPPSKMTLDHVRSEIDGLDRQIVQLIAERQKWVVTAGGLKKDEGAVRAPARVQHVIDKVRGLAEDSQASPEVVEATYRAMIAAFIDLELDHHRAG